MNFACFLNHHGLQYTIVCYAQCIYAEKQYTEIINASNRSMEILHSNNYYYS